MDYFAESGYKWIADLGGWFFLKKGCLWEEGNYGRI